MLEHGFVSVGASTTPVLSSASDGAISMQVVPPGWNSSSDSYSWLVIGSQTDFVISQVEVISVNVLCLGSRVSRSMPQQRCQT
eukprot:symbB.v1.2.033613.t3/scaffold4200.1/size43131/4